MRGVRAAAYLALVAAARASESAAGLLTHAAAGLVRLDELRTSIREEWRASGARESDRYILAGLMPWEREFYGRFLRATDRVLLVGCGTGRDLIALLEQGYRADGLDVVPECVETARRLVRERGLSASVHAGELGSVTAPTRYDAVVFSWGCYGLIPHAERRIATLRQAAAALEPGGRILLSYALASTAPPRPLRATQLIARLSRSDWRPERGDLLQLSGRRRGLARYSHTFEPPELEAEARAAALQLLHHGADEHGLAVLTL